MIEIVFYKDRDLFKNNLFVRIFEKVIKLLLI
jgi:hypothetical protein